jgi:hypothetical protein
MSFFDSPIPISSDCLESILFQDLFGPKRAFDLAMHDQLNTFWQGHRI